VVNSISNSLLLDAKAANADHRPRERVDTRKESGSQKAAMDTVTLQQSSMPATTYSTPLSSEEIADKGYEMLRKLVTTLLGEQGANSVIANADSEIDIGKISPEEAAELIAEDGYFGVGQTSDRIVKFAIAAAGGDVGRLDAIKEGVEKGFNEAFEAFGGSLPDISHTTFDAVMEKLDAWAAEADGK